MYNSYGLESQGTTVVGTGAPSIVAKRRLLDDKFPYLAFAVDTRGLPFYEVLLATDPQVFSAEVLADPAALAGVGPIVVVCQIGVRARRAAEALRAAGIEASVLAGGVEAWRSAATVRV